MSWVKEITDEDLSAGKIANLPDHPNRGAGFGETGLTASKLKAYFDKNVELLQKTINNIIQEGNPATLAGKIDLGGNGFFPFLSNLVASIDDEGGDFSNKIWVNVDGYTDVLNGFLGLLQKTKVESVKGGSVKGAAYVVDENGDDKTLGYSSDAEPNTIVKRTESGDILLPEGSSDERAAISRKDAAALLSEAVTKDAFEEEKLRTNAFVKSAKVEYDEANHVIRLTFTDGNGETDTSSVDLPLEMAFVGARLEEGNLVFTLQNGQEVSVPIGDVLGGLVTSGALAQALDGNEEDKAPSVKAVNEGLEGKVDMPTYAKADCLLATDVKDETTGRFKTKILTHNGSGTSAHIAKFLNASIASAWLDKKPDFTLGGADPIYPIQYTTKRYVDNKYRDLEHSVYNALGVLYTFESIKLRSPYNEIPVGALSIAYLESIGGVNVYSNANGDRVLVGTTDIVAIHINGANSERLGTYDPTAPQYIELPAGAVSIVFECREPTVTVWDTLELDASIKYQIKVGA